MSKRKRPLKKPVTGKSRCANLRNAVMQGHVDWMRGVTGEGGQRPTTRQVTAGQLKHMLEQQEQRCLLTSVKLTPATASLDHIRPVSKGGKHTIDNLMIVHKEVNRAKSTMHIEDFVGMCAAITAQAKLCGVDVVKLAQRWKEQEAFDYA